MSDSPLSLPDWIGQVGPDRLDDFVALIDGAGGLGGAAMAEITARFRYHPEVTVDQTLDPVGPDYTDQMIALYREISGRDLDQDTGEFHHFNIPNHVHHANPYASNDVTFIAKHARTVLTALVTANLPKGAKVLDLGSGWGLSTEMMTYAGADVTAVDINPWFIALIKRRGERQGQDRKAVQSNFDDIAFEDRFDMAFFYECMHHSVRPWVTLERVAAHMAPNGRIVFAGEPINDTWWRHWGLRLNAPSVYCIRKYGWFESGWSEAFLTAMFDRMGWSLELVPAVGLDGGEIGFAHRVGDPAVPRLNVPDTPRRTAPQAPLWRRAVRRLRAQVARR